MGDRATGHVTRGMGAITGGKLGLTGAAFACAMSLTAASARAGDGRASDATGEAQGRAARAQAEGEPAPAPAAVEVIFTGFARRSDKGASIFVRMTGEVPVSFEHSGRRLVYHLSGAKLGVPNNANPLPTGQFGPPVSSVALVPGTGTVDVVIELTDDPGDKAPAHRVVSHSGISTLVIELPPPAAQ